MKRRKRKLGVVVRILNGEKVEFVTKNYGWGIGTYKRYPERGKVNGAAKFKRNVEAHKKQLAEAMLLAPRVIELAETWNAQPQYPNGISLTALAIRVYIGRVIMGWSIDVSCAALGFSTWSAHMCVSRVEDARDEPWFDEYLSGIEHALQRDVCSSPGTDLDEERLAAG